MNDEATRAAYRAGVKRSYHNLTYGYETCLADLEKSGMTASEADDYLFAKDDVLEAATREGDSKIFDAIERAAFSQ